MDVPSLLAFHLNDLPSLPFTVALAVVAVLGYLFGHRGREPGTASADSAVLELRPQQVICRPILRLSSTRRWTRWPPLNGRAVAGSFVHRARVTRDSESTDPSRHLPGAHVSPSIDKTP